jgi:GNAT superfamily N-acetyltransferase
MDTVVILPARITEISDILEMMADFYAIDNYEFNKELAHKNLETFISTKNYGRIWVLKSHQELMGYVILAFSYSFEYGGINAFIDELYIKPGYRNKGLSKTALEFVLKEAKALGIQTLHLEVEKHNKKARNIYTQWGFTDKDRLLLSKKID